MQQVSSCVPCYVFQLQLTCNLPTTLNSLTSNALSRPYGSDLNESAIATMAFAFQVQSFRY